MTIHFIHTDQGLCIESDREDLPGLFCIDYDTGTMGYRLTKERALHEPLAKVLGKRTAQTSLHVLDATAGLGRDGLLLALLDCKVTLCEANAIIYVLVADALERAKHHPHLQSIIEHNIQLLYCDSGALLLEMRAQPEKYDIPDIIYLDPMFPPRKKSALVKKEMRWLQAILEEVNQPPLPENFSHIAPIQSITPIEDVFNLALQVAKKRVIVKRPTSAPMLCETPIPSFSKEFQSCRYDVYLIN